MSTNRRPRRHLSLLAAAILATATTKTQSADFYWAGTLSNIWNDTSALTTNWRTDPTSNIDTTQLPDPLANIFFATTTPPATNLTTTLNQNFTINSLHILPGTAPVTINDTNNSLTLTNGITLDPGSNGLTLNTNVQLAANQTWDATTTIAHTRTLSLNSSTLTLAGTGTISLNGTITGSGSLIKNGEGNLILAGQSTLSGDLQLNGGTTTITGVIPNIASVFVGTTTAPTVLQIQGGTLTTNVTASFPDGLSAPLIIAATPGGAASLRMSSGILNPRGNILLGDPSTAQGYASMTFAGGTIGSITSLIVGSNRDYAIFNMSGGVITIPMNVNRGLIIGGGTDGGGSTGVANISGGTISGRTFVGQNGNGILNISGNAILGNVIFGLTFTSDPAPISSGIINLLGGTLTGVSGSNDTGPSILNYHGGVLSTSVGSGITTYVYAGGTNFVSRSSGITSNHFAPLLAPTGNGLSSITVSGGAGYMDAPMVIITPALGDTTGTGATANAIIDAAGNLTGITITNPGVDYLLPPIVTLIGGGGSGASVNSAIITPNVGGGLTKSGSYALVISNTANTYTGPTEVLGGTLYLTGALMGTGTVTMHPGTKLGGTGYIAGRVILAAGTSSSSQASINLLTSSDVLISSHFSEAANTFTLAGGLTAGGPTGAFSTMSLEVGGLGPTNDRLDLGASSLDVNPGGFVLSLTDLGVLVQGTYTLISYNNVLPPQNVRLNANSTKFNFNTASLIASTTSVDLVVTGPPVPTTAYWSGEYGALWTNAGGTAKDQANFQTAASGGNNTLQLPSTTTDVYFATDVSKNLTTTLGRNFVIKSLTVKANSGPVAINGTSSLEILTGVITVESGSGGLTIAAPLVVAGPHVWTNLSNTPVAISGNLQLTNISLNLLGNFLFTLNTGLNQGGGTVTISPGSTVQVGGPGAGLISVAHVVNYGSFVIDYSGPAFVPAHTIEGNGSLMKMGSGGLTLDANSSYSGGTTIASGTLQITMDSALGTGPVLNQAALQFALHSDGHAVFNDITGPGSILLLPRLIGPPPPTLTLTGTHDYAGSTTISSGKLIFAGSNSHVIGIVTGAGTLQVDPNSAITSDGVTTAIWEIDGNHIIRSSNTSAGTSKITTLLISRATDNAFAGTLNLTDNKLILQSTDPADKQQKIADLTAALNSGKHAGDWLGTGITSSTLSTPGTTMTNSYALGLFDNAIHNLTSFGGQPTNTNSLFTTIAHLGDTNLDGTVDIQDLGIIANNWQSTNTTWSRGDLNLDGVIDIQDLGILANNWQQTNTFSLSALVPQSLSAFDSAFRIPNSAFSTPEPTTLLLLTTTLPLLLRRRPNKKSKI